jgi:predicted Rossmann fold nucleotide-binding protein DprA/Smf involved in DNA uptake
MEVLRLCGADGVSVSRLASETGIRAGRVQQILLELELGGHVRRTEYCGYILEKEKGK